MIFRVILNITLFKCVLCLTSFYLIEPEKFLMFRACDHETPFERKHFNAVFVIDSLREHPDRVFDPQKANLVFVPALFDLLFTRRCQNKFSDEYYLNDTIAVIRSENLYPAKKHIALPFSWHFRYSKHYWSFKRQMPALITSSYEDFHTDCEFPVAYSNNYDCSFLYNGPALHRIHLAHGLHDRAHSIPILRDSSYESFSRRKILAEFTGSADRRPGYKDRYYLFNTSTYLTSSFSHPVWITVKNTTKTPQHFRPCNTSTDVMSYIQDPWKSKNIFDRCILDLPVSESQAIRENARFSLCFRGDTLGADRWFNSLLSGTIIAAFGPSLDEVVSWTPFREVIPWKDMIVFIPLKRFYEDPIAVIDSLNDIPRQEIEEKLRLMRKHAADVSLIAPNSRVIANVVNAARNANCSYYNS